MNNDIRPVGRLRPRPQSSTEGLAPRALQPAPLDSLEPDRSTQLPAPVVDPATTKPRRDLWKWLLIGLGCVFLILVGAGVWYTQAQHPVKPGATDKISLTIEPGSTPNQIGSLLKERGLIRSELAFSIYTRLHGAQASLQAGDYRLSPSQDLAAIVAELQAGQSEEFDITFYPGATLMDPTDLDDEKRTDVYTMLRRAGYEDGAIRSAFERQYDHPLLADKPRDASLEGYVYGDTYRFSAGVSVEDILTRTFDEFYSQITERHLVDKLQRHDMTLHEGIILASIIEREVSGLIDDQKQVSQIFHLRMNKGMSLGADATFMYAAQQQNSRPTSNFDSPYNTRLHVGLPPGPISSPNITALEAAAEPAPGDYLYFVSGDDGTTHFAHTMAEHEQNTRQYCTDLCFSIE